MKRIAIVIFDHFTDIDLFLMWDILGRCGGAVRVSLLGAQAQHHSAHSLPVRTHGPLSDASRADAVLFTSGKSGVPKFLADRANLDSLSLDPRRQLIGSICAGSFILAKLGLLREGPATTHPEASVALAACGMQVVDRPLVCRGNVVTAGGCLSALYLTGWIVERLLGQRARVDVLRELLPAGQREVYEALIEASIRESTDPVHEAPAGRALQLFPR